MRFLFVAAALAMMQVVAAQESRPTVDRVKLRNGSTLEGVILSEVNGYIEMRVGPGISVGFQTSKTEEVLRGVQPMATAEGERESPLRTPEPMPAANVPPRDEWFLLHGLDGVSLGTVHLTIEIEATDLGPVERLEESWVFTEELRSHGINRIERAGMDLKPIDFFFRELITEKETGRTVHEKIVRGERAEDRLLVEVMSPVGRTKRVEKFDPLMSFPLTFREGLRRQRAAAPKTLTVTLYEPLQETFVQRIFTLGEKRKVSGLSRKDEIEEVSVLKEERWGAIHEEWLDQRGAIRRFEVNGTHLVARACTAAEAAAASARRVNVVASQTRRDKGSRFAASLPQPGWRFVGDASRETMEMDDPAQAASISLVFLDQLGRDATAETAVAALERGFKLVHPDYRSADAADRAPGTIEGVFSGQAGASGAKVVPFHVALRAIASPAGFVGVSAAAPQTAWGAVVQDFRRAISLVDCSPEEASSPAK